MIFAQMDDKVYGGDQERGQGRAEAGWPVINAVEPGCS